jgi:hypothetical protein
VGGICLGVLWDTAPASSEFHHFEINNSASCSGGLEFDCWPQTVLTDICVCVCFADPPNTSGLIEYFLKIHHSHFHSYLP